MSESEAIFRMVDSVTVRVPDLDSGMVFYCDRLGHELIWRADDLGQAGLRLPDSSTELVLSTNHEYAPNWLVTSVAEATEVVLAGGGAIAVASHQTPVGNLAVVTDPFGNTLVLLDLAKGRYVTDAEGRVTAVKP